MISTSSVRSRTRGKFLSKVGAKAQRIVASRPSGPTAIETLLAALGACMAGTFAAQATARGIAIDALEVDLEGAIDLNGFFGLQPISPGLSDVRLAFRVRSDADEAALLEVLQAARSLSPVFDSVTRPVGVDVTLAKA